MESNGQNRGVVTEFAGDNFGEEGTWYCLRPGGTVFESSSEQIQIVFPNHTATFNGIPVVNAIRALIAAFSNGNALGDAIRLVAQQGSLDESFIRYVFSLLKNCQCLYTTGSVNSQFPIYFSHGGRDRLGEFFASVGVDPLSSLTALGSMKTVLLTPARLVEDTEIMFKEAAIPVKSVAVEEAASCDNAIAQFFEMTNEGDPLVVCWGFPYRLPFARIVNKECVARNLKAIYGVCEGLIGRVGPFVIPGCSPCLECLNTRALSNADAYEMRAAEHFTLSPDNPLPAPWPAHPVFSRSILALLALEVSRVGLLLPPTTLGRLTELFYHDGAQCRRSLIKVPGCRVCRSAMAKRFAWNKVVPELPVANLE